MRELKAGEATVLQRGRAWERREGNRCVQHAAREEGGEREGGEEAAAGHGGEEKGREAAEASCISTEGREGGACGALTHPTGLVYLLIPLGAGAMQGKEELEKRFAEMSRRQHRP